MAITLVINPGSSSKKYALYDDGRVLLTARFEQSGAGYERCLEFDGVRQLCEPVDAPTFSDALGHVLAVAAMRGLPPVDSVGIRIVSPGRRFTKHALVDESYVHDLRENAHRAPAHIPGALAEIERVREHLPSVTPVAVSDSAFHVSMPAYARRFSIPAEDASRLDLERFGYHGLSVASVARKLEQLTGQMPTRTIVCHVGSGVSVTALKEGASVDTTMGYAPGGGLIMSGRAGDLDAPALIALMEGNGFSATEASEYIQSRGGLRGFTGVSDMRVVLKRYREHDEQAGLALDAFFYQMTLAVGGYAASLGGLDTLVLTATAFERNPELRERFIERLSMFDIMLDTGANEQVVSRDAVITQLGSLPAVWVITTDEMGEIMRITRSIA